LGQPDAGGFVFFLGTKATGIVGACGAAAGLVFWFAGLSGESDGETQDQAGGKREAECEWISRAGDQGSRARGGGEIGDGGVRLFWMEG